MKPNSLQKMELSLTVFFLTVMYVFSWPLQLLFLLPAFRAFFNFVFPIFVQFEGNVDGTDDGLCGFFAVEGVDKIVPPEQGNSSVDEFFGGMWIFVGKFSFAEEIDDDVGVVLDEEGVIDVLLVCLEVEFFFVADKGIMLNFGHEP